MYTINDVEAITYDFEKEVMTVELKKSVIYNKFSRRKINYKVSYEAFIDSSDKLIKSKV